MIARLSPRLLSVVLCAAVVVAPGGSFRSDAPLFAQEAAAPRPLSHGQRVFSAGHSFHMFVPNLLAGIARSAEIEDHVQVGRQSIGGSRVIQHWDMPDDRNAVKQALGSGEVDVLTLSPIYLPDEGIENFVQFGREHNRNLRVTLQAFWLPYDVYNTNYKRERPAPVDRNSRTAEQLRAMHADYFQSLDEHVAALNGKYADAVRIVPVAQAVIALREKIIAGEAPGLQQQDDLFRDAIGHPTPPLQVLTAYCHYAVIYGRSPVGLPRPAVLPAASDDLNRLLQELAWDAVRTHPHGGIAAGPTP